MSCLYLFYEWPRWKSHRFLVGTSCMHEMLGCLFLRLLEAQDRLVSTQLLAIYGIISLLDYVGNYAAMLGALEIRHITQKNDVTKNFLFPNVK